MFEGWIGLLALFGIIAFADHLMLWLLGCWYWFWHKHRSDRATYDVTARCKCHPQFEGRGRSKIEALRKLEAAVQLGDAKERAR